MENTQGHREEPAQSWRPETEAHGGEYRESTAHAPENGNALGAARERIQALGHYLCEAGEMAQQKLAELKQKGVEQMKCDVLNFTRQRPTNALLVAAGIGVLVGVLTRRRH